MKSVIKTKAPLIAATIISVSLLFSCAGNAKENSSNTELFPEEIPAESNENTEPETEIQIPETESESEQEQDKTEQDKTEIQNQDSENTETPDTENNLNSGDEADSPDTTDSESTETTETTETCESTEDNMNNGDETDSLPPLPPIEEPEVFDEPVLEDLTPPEDIDPETEPVSEAEKETPVTSDEITDLTDLDTVINTTTEDDSQNDEVLEIAPDSNDDEVMDIDINIDASSPEETTEPEQEPEPELPQIIPSRSVTLKNGETLEVEYPGKGWIYLGCTDGSKNLTSSGRKIGSKNTNFTLIARVPGTVILHFYKEDILEGKYIDDYLEVTVQSLKGKSSSRVKAPSYAEVVPKKPEPAVKQESDANSISEKAQNTVSDVTNTESKSEVLPESKPENKPETTETKPENTTEISTEEQPVKKQVAPAKSSVSETKIQSSPQNQTPVQTELLNAQEYLSKSKETIKAIQNGETTLDEKSYADCYNNLQVFLSIADQDKDEGFYLLGKLYEDNGKGNSKFRNVKKAIESYEEITQNYPLSSFYEEAKKRIIYLKRFYINIR